MGDAPNPPEQSGEQSTAAEPIHRGSTVVGAYHLLQRVGEGGMGEVWLADQTRPVRRQVALKIIKPGMDTSQVVARFEAERQALALMAHPANIAEGRGRHEEAVLLYTEAISILKKVGTPADVAVGLLNLGGALLWQRKYPAAISALRESMDIGLRNLGRENLTTAAAMSNLAKVLSDSGEYAQAEPLQRDVLAIRRKLYGDNHFDVAMARYNLGNTLNGLGHFDEAAQMLRESVAVYRSTFPDRPHFQMAWALTDLGSVECERRQYDEAERLHREAAAMFLKLDPQATFVGKPWYGIAEARYRRGDRAEAEKYFRMDLELLKKHADTPPAVLAWPETALGQLLTERGRPEEAEPLLRHALASLRADPPPEKWRTAYAEVLLGACLVTRRQFEEAEQLLLDGYAGLHTMRGDDRDESRYAVTALVALFEALGKPDQAAKWSGKLTNNRDQ
jgi:tetratricopeptide (TPR) repeat protein